MVIDIRGSRVFSGDNREFLMNFLSLMDPEKDDIESEDPEEGYECPDLSGQGNSFGTFQGMNFELY